MGFAGELSTILDSVPDRGLNQTANTTGQQNGSENGSTLAAPLFIAADGKQVMQAKPGAGANKNSDYVPDDTAGNVSGSSIGFASLDDDELD